MRNRPYFPSLNAGGGTKTICIGVKQARGELNIC